MIKRSLLWVLAAYCSGIVFRDRLKWILWAVLFSYAFLIYVIYGRGRLAQRLRETVPMLWEHLRREETYFLMILPLVLLLGAFLGKLQGMDYPIDAVLGKKTEATAEGRIRSITETKSGYRLELNHAGIVLHNFDTEQRKVIEYGAEEKYTKGKLLVYCESVEGLKIGYRIRLEGQAVPFTIPENAGQFDERAYYRAERMCCKFNADEITVMNDDADDIREWCRMIRNRMDAIYEEILPEKHAGIVSAILLGDKAELDANTKALYQKNGIAHILAISGLHVSLLGLGLFAVIRKSGSPLIPAAAATILILVFYGCLTDFSVSTQRAVGMLVIAMFARILGRSYDSRSACALCGLFILLVNPMQLYQTGFQLSFGAAFGISYFGRELEKMKLNKGKRAKEKLRSALLSGLTTQLITTPIILNCFYELPVYALFLNLPVIGLLSVVVFLSILAGVAGIVSYSIGEFFAGTVYMILEFYELLCRVTEKLPCPIWLYGKPKGSRILLYFLVLGCFFFVAKKIGEHYRHHPRQAHYRRWAFFVLGLLPLVFINGRADCAGEGTVNFLSVGQGDCAVVRSQNKNTYLIDCGSSSVKSVGEYRLKPWLKYHGISKLEAVFLSHPDSDHTNGIAELLEKANSPDDWYRGEIRIANLILPSAYKKETEEVVKRMENITEGQEDRTSEKGFAEIYRLACEAKIPVLWFDTGDYVEEDEIRFTCLHPEADYPVRDTNDASIVLLLEGQELAVLFTGDIGANGEECVIQVLNDIVNAKEENSKRGNVENTREEKTKGSNKLFDKTTVLKVAHHGSKNATSTEFLEILQPDVAVISCGRENRFGHPHEETLLRLQQSKSRIVNTMDKGTVTMHILQHK